MKKKWFIRIDRITRPDGYTRYADALVALGRAIQEIESSYPVPRTWIDAQVVTESEQHCYRIYNYGNE